MKNENILNNNANTATTTATPLDRLVTNLSRAAEKRNFDGVKERKNSYDRTFGELLDAYNTYATYAFATDNTNYEPYVDALQSLATACAYSVLATCIDPLRKSGKKSQNSDGAAQNPYLLEMKRDIARDTSNLATLNEMSNFSDTLTYTKDGTITNVTRDKMDDDDVDVLNTMNTLSSDTIGDGYDLVQTAIEYLLEESVKCFERENVVDLEATYTIHELSRHVYIQSESSVDGWKDRETCAVREVYRGVRHTVEASRAMQMDARSGYSYIEDYAIDGDGNTIEDMAIYRRLPHFANYGGYGANGLYTVDNNTVYEINEIVTKMHLTAIEKPILTAKMCGKGGNKALATYFGRSENSIKGACNRIKSKAEKVGLTPESYEKALKERENTLSDRELLARWQDIIPHPIDADTPEKITYGLIDNIYQFNPTLTISDSADDSYMDAMRNFYNIWNSAKK